MSEEEVKKLSDSAEQALQAGNADNAISLYNKVIEIDPRNANAYTKLAELYESKGMKDEAASKYLFIGNAYYESKLLKGSMKFFQKVLELDPKRLDAREKLAQIYESEDMEREAKMEFLHVAEDYLEHKDLNKAEEFSQKAISLKSIEAHYVLGKVFYERAMFKEAITEFEYILKFKMKHTGALNYVGNSYMKLNKFPEAIITFDKVLKIEENNLEAMEGIALAYKNKGDIAGAVTNYLSAAKEYTNQKDIDKANSILKEAEAVSAGNAEAQNKIAVFYEAVSNKDKAKEFYIKAGKLFMKNRTKDNAQLCFTKALEIDPGSIEANDGLKEITSSVPDASAKELKQEKAEKTEIKKEIKEEIKEKPAGGKFEENVPAEIVTGGAEDLMIQADQNLKDGFFQKAIDIYRHLLKQNPADMTVRQKLHQAYILAAQQEQEITDKAKDSAPKIDGKKPKKNKISYL